METLPPNHITDLALPRKDNMAERSRISAERVMSPQSATSSPPFTHFTPSHTQSQSQGKQTVSSAGFRSYASVSTSSASQDSNGTDPSSQSQNTHDTSRSKPRENTRRDPTPLAQTPEQRQRPVSTFTHNGHKRTASGLEKPGSIKSPLTSPTYTHEAVPRASSESSNSSKTTGAVGEAAAQLKTRLKYAMAKVAHGWQDCNIDQVEALAAQLPQPSSSSSSSSSSPARGGRGVTSPKPALSNAFAVYDARPVWDRENKRRSGGVSWAGAETIIPAQPSHYPSGEAPVASLAPAADIRTAFSSPPHKVNGTHRRQLSNNARPTLQKSSSEEYTEPSTPSKRVVGLETNQAEMDAMDALMLMGGSPSGSQQKGGQYLLQQQHQQHQQHQQQQQQQHQQQKHQHQHHSSHPQHPLTTFPPTHQIQTHHQAQTQSQNSSLALSPLPSTSSQESAADNSMVKGSDDRGNDDRRASESASGQSSPGSGQFTREGRERVLDEVEEGV